MQAEDIPLAALLRELVDDFAPQTTQAQVNITVTAEPMLVARGERFLVRQALANLLANAIDFAPVGSAIVIAAHGQDGMAVVTVRDHGPGIPSWAKERLFERFYRSEDARSKPGSGLGLAIVKQIAQAHGGSVRAENMPDGGALVGFSIPPVQMGTQSGPA